MCLQQLSQRQKNIFCCMRVRIKKMHTNTYLLEYLEGKLRGKERDYFHVSHFKVFHGSIE